MKSRLNIAVIGAGASGMTAAITAAKYGADVTLYEKNDRVGKKILATGNGKCNLSNMKLSVDQYYCKEKEKLIDLFSVFSTQDTFSFFNSMGLMIKDKNGYLYPYSEQASSVLDILRMELDRSGVRTVTGVKIVDAVYQAQKKSFQLTDMEGKTYFYQKVIIACGSPASLKNGEGMTGYEIARKLGHKIHKLVPGLVQLRSDEKFIKALSGVRCQAGVQLIINGEIQAGEIGEVQFTEYGVSGIPIFQFSRLAAYALEERKQVSVVIDFFPEKEEKEFLSINRLRYDSMMDKSVEDYLTGTLNKKINMVMLKQAGLKPDMKAQEAGWKKIWELMRKSRSFVIHISSVNPIENAQVCAGGVDFKQVDAGLQSKLVKNLYFAGEILDVDGKCGGYNLQWAWTSGYVAGMNAAGFSTKEKVKG
ncbi:MAG: NAD(P)/FAD-dependent oxidoreductase [Suilimivivens sp.]